MWNVNTDDGSESVIKYIRINRNIVECKFSSISTLKYCCIFELIETLWNVNEDYFTAEESAVEESTAAETEDTDTESAAEETDAADTESTAADGEATADDAAQAAQTENAAE